MGFLVKDGLGVYMQNFQFWLFGIFINGHNKENFIFQLGLVQVFIFVKNSNIIQLYLLLYEYQQYQQSIAVLDFYNSKKITYKPFYLSHIQLTTICLEMKNKATSKQSTQQKIPTTKTVSIASNSNVGSQKQAQKQQKQAIDANLTGRKSVEKSQASGRNSQMEKNVESKSVIGESDKKIQISGRKSVQLDKSKSKDKQTQKQKIPSSQKQQSLKKATNSARNSQVQSPAPPSGLSNPSLASPQNSKPQLPSSSSIQPQTVQKQKQKQAKKPKSPSRRSLPLSQPISIKPYLEKNFQQVVNEGLKQILKQQPQDPIRFLGEFLVKFSQSKPNVK